MLIDTDASSDLCFALFPFYTSPPLTQGVVTDEPPLRFFLVDAKDVKNYNVSVDGVASTSIAVYCWTRGLGDEARAGKTEKIVHVSNYSKFIVISYSTLECFNSYLLQLC